jgi:hypothetical protein
VFSVVAVIYKPAESLYVFIGIPAYPGTVVLGLFYFCGSNLAWLMSLLLIALFEC